MTRARKPAGLLAVAPQPTERQAQRTVLQWLALVLPPGSMVHHVANEAAVNPKWTPHQKARYFEERRKDGVLLGFPDLLILLPGRKLVLVEMKRPDGERRGGQLSKEQKALHPQLLARGFPLVVARTIEDVAAVLRADGVPLREAYGAEARAA